MDGSVCCGGCRTRIKFQSEDTRSIHSFYRSTKRDARGMLAMLGWILGRLVQHCDAAQWHNERQAFGPLADFILRSPVKSDSSDTFTVYPTTTTPPPTTPNHTRNRLPRHTRARSAVLPPCLPRRVAHLRHFQRLTSLLYRPSPNSLHPDLRPQNRLKKTRGFYSRLLHHFR